MFPYVLNELFKKQNGNSYGVCHEEGWGGVDKPARLAIVPDCQISYKNTNSGTVLLTLLNTVY